MSMYSYSTLKYAQHKKTIQNLNWEIKPSIYGNKRKRQDTEIIGGSERVRREKRGERGEDDRKQEIKHTTE